MKSDIDSGNGTTTTTTTATAATPVGFARTEPSKPAAATPAKPQPVASAPTHAKPVATAPTAAATPQPKPTPPAPQPKAAAAPAPQPKAAAPAPQPKTAAPQPQPRPTSGRVSLEFMKSDAKQVCVAGDFNGWKPEATPLTQVSTGRWVGNVSMKPGRHEYLFVVDGQWLPDPNAKETVQNPFGGKNSVLTVSA